MKILDRKTFSLFGAGRSFRRVDTTLVSTGSPSIAGALNTFLLPSGTTGVVPPTSVPRRHRQRSVTLRTPEPDTHLDTPPSPDVQVSNWQEAEDFVAQLLSANSFEVRDFSRLRGYGFDLWARHTTTSTVYYVEVKSSSSINRCGRPLTGGAPTAGIAPRPSTSSSRSSASSMNRPISRS